MINTSDKRQSAEPVETAPCEAPLVADTGDRSAGRCGARLAWLLAAIIFLGSAAGAVWLATHAGVPVTVTLDGRSEAMRTTRPDVRSLLADLGVTLRPEDQLAPALDTPIAPGLAVTVRRARLGWVEADGTLYQTYVQGGTFGDLAAAAGVRLAEHDELWADGAQISAASPLPEVEPSAELSRFARARPWIGTEPPPLRLSVVRAVAVVVDDGSVPYTIYTTAPTIGEALLREGVMVYLGDTVRPSLGSAAAARMRVTIERSKPVFVTADGRTTHTRTRGKTVGGILMDLGIPVAGNDRVTPPLDQPVVDQQQIRVVRVSEVTLVQGKPIPYESQMVPDDELEIDQQRLAQAGRNGEHRTRYKVVYEDGREIARTLVDEWVAAQPVTRILAYGRKIVSRSLETPEGAQTYWRKIRMYATSYSPARAGTPKTAPWYGRTRIGLPLKKGLVAVDPKVIPLQSWVYVPGYGVGMAADTGGGVKGKWIDMGYSDDDYVSWHWWVDVYVLTPPPAAGKIMWVLPNYPPPGFPRSR